MKVVNYTLMSCLVGLLLALFLVIWPELIADYLVFILGLLFFIPGIVSIIMQFVNRSPSQFHLLGIGSLLFGLLMMIKPSFFANAILFVLGLVLAGGGLFQIVGLQNAKSWTKVSFVAYIVPIILFILGIAIMFNPSETKETTFFMLGIGLFIYSISGLIYWLFYTRKRPRDISKEMDISDAEIVEE